MARLFLILIFSLMMKSQNKWLTPFELGNGNQSPSYKEMMFYYQEIANSFESIKIFEKGTSDDGIPMSVIIFDASKQFDFDSQQLKILINNNIHPGEPDGVDASMQFLRDLALNKIENFKNVMIAIIPCYNIEGMKNRGSYSRANQNGPEAYGFRGNGKNYDLNRDFVKADTKNTKAFYQIFHTVKPDIFIDNHVSNGADYQYTLTLIETQSDKLGGDLGTFMKNNFTKHIEQQLNQKNIDVVPYVNVYNKPPEEGFHQIMDSPRYSSGYTSLFNVISYLPETHMLKPYADRVKVTYEFIFETYLMAHKKSQEIKILKQQNNQHYKVGSPYPLHWSIDSTQFNIINFKGYEATYKTSKVTGQQRLYYDRNQPFEKPVKYYDTYQPTHFVNIPSFYVIPKTEYRILELLELNDIKFQVLTVDEEREVEVYYIDDYKTYNTAYEGHYLHYDTKVKRKTEHVKLTKGTVVVNTQQQGLRFLIETLEPEATDSFFNWNFFDSILQQKEGFSAYVFEDLAWDLLQNNKELKLAFESKKQSDKDFADNARMQLNWIYKNSPYYEREHLRYPVYRIK